MAIQEYSRMDDIVRPVTEALLNSASSYSPDNYSASKLWMILLPSIHALPHLVSRVWGCSSIQSDHLYLLKFIATCKNITSRLIRIGISLYLCAGGILCLVSKILYQKTSYPDTWFKTSDVHSLPYDSTTGDVQRSCNSSHQARWGTWSYQSNCATIYEPNEWKYNSTTRRNSTSCFSSLSLHFSTPSCTYLGGKKKTLHRKTL